mmetsp:Transcript_7195/g.10699  ORF Transcript_7195/g.10699 Transcript_7195/m.10699 type:complete len:141 (+) Transcript_7195:50-472(+)
MASNKVYVGNLPFSATDVDVQQLFEGHGKVIGINLRVDRNTGKQRGFGFVTFEDPASALSAIHDLHGTDFFGRTLTVSAATARGSASESSQGDVDTSWKTAPPKRKSDKKGGKQQGNQKTKQRDWSEWASPTPAMSTKNT